MPIEFAAKTTQEDFFNWIRTLTGKVIGDRLMIQGTIYQSQQDQKRQFDNNIRVIQYKIGDLILLYSRSDLRGKRKLQE